MRLFVSLPLPVELAAPLEDFLDVRRDADRSAARARGGPADWSWTLPDQWHLTLAFAGDVPPDRQQDWADALAEVAAAHQPFTLELSGAGAFPHPDAAKVLYLRAGVVTPAGSQEPAGSEALARLAAAVRTSAHRVGVHADGQPFTPHVTVARSRRGISATRWLRVVDTFVGPRWPVTSFDLVESQRSGAGSRASHHTLLRCPLGVSTQPGE